MSLSLLYLEIHRYIDYIDYIYIIMHIYTNIHIYLYIITYIVYTHTHPIVLFLWRTLTNIQYNGRGSEYMVQVQVVGER